MTNLEKISQLRALLSSTILPLIDNDYVLLDIPYYSNPGDTLIWEGTEQLLSQCKYKCLIRTAEESFSFPKLPHNIIILLQGGGNWGDLWLRHQYFRNKIVETYPKNKIIILPQSIHYNDSGNWIIDSEKLKRHNNLHICARDWYSFDLINKVGLNYTYLLPDMAFGINAANLSKYITKKSGRNLLIKRDDIEKPNYQQLNIDITNKQFDILDWPTMKSYDSTQLNFYRIYNRRKFGLIAITDWYANRILRPHIIKKSVRFISQYEIIYTTRLHAAILSILLDKPVTLIDNSYGKNSNFYKTWLFDLDTITLEI